MEEPISISADGIVLQGTLTLPEGEGRCPLVLMIAGSGPVDRDENMGGQKLDIFNTIANRLAEIGVASVRYDKRGIGASGGNFLTAGHTELVQDAIRWYDAARSLDRREIGGIYLLGHSEGTLIAPQVLAERPEIAGMILLSPTTDNIESVLLKQGRHVNEHIASLKGVGGWLQRILFRLMGMNDTSQQRLIAKLRATDAPTLRIGLQKIPAKSFRELLQLDPPALFRGIRCPMLVIGGEKDLQCDPGDVERIAQLSQGAVEGHVIPNMVHILRLEEGRATIFGNPELLKQPVAPVVLDLIADWMRRQ